MSPVSTGFLLLLSFLVVANANVNIQIPTLTDQLQRIHNYGFAQISMGGGEPNGATASEQTSTNSLSSRIRPCEWHYWRLNAATAWGNNLDKTDYLHVNITNVAEDEDLPQASADTFILLVKYYEEDVSSISELPTLDNFDWKITVTAARTAALTDNFMELWPCEMYNTGFYWFAVGGMDFPEGVIAEYDFDVSRRRGLGQCFEDTCSSGAPVTVLPLGQANRINVVHETRRPSDLNPYADQVNQFDQDRLRDWRFFSIDLSGTAYVPGSYLVVNISHVDSDAPTGLTEFLFYSNFGKVPYLVDGHLDQMTDMNGDSPDRCQSSACYAGGNSASACECTVEDYPCKAEREREQSCDLVVGPCTFSYDFDPDSETSNNLWFLGVRIPLSVYDQGTDTLELSFLNFSLWAEVVQPTVTDLVLGIPERGQVAFPNQGLLLYDDAVHYRFELTSVGPNTNLQVHLRNIWTPGSQSQLFAALRAFEKTPGKTTWPDYTLASNQDTYTGCPCYPENDWMCTGCDQCQILVPKCTLIAPASYFLAVGFQSGVATGPIPFEVEVELYDDAAPAILYAGVPVHGQVPWRGYDFYLMNVPNTVRTWLYAELFTNGRAGDVTLRALFGELPGGFCYQDPDFSCSTGDQSSCYFMVDSCHLQEGPLYFSVTGVTSLAERNRNSRPTPTPYTLWAEFETPWELENNVTYTEHLRDAQYNHYYIRAQNVVQGSWWTIEIDNFQGEDFNAYVNYQELAGECPCYSSLFNCTGNLPAPDCSDADPECVPNWDSNYALDRQTYTPGFPAFKQACKIEVDACSFREGIWYISVGIVGESTIQGSPISGYTITSIIHPPPEVRNFPLNFQYVDWVAPHQINHYRLGAVVTDSQTNLVVRLTWMQDEVGRYNGVFSNVALPIHQLLDNGNLNLRLEQGSLALPECYDHPWSCSANTNSYSSCTLVVPYCTWSTWTEDVFVSVQYVPNSDSFDAQFTLEAHLEQESVIPLLPSVEYYGSVNQGRYVHYALDVVPVIQTNTRLTITVYFNSDRKSSPVLLQLNDRAGGERYQSGPCTDCKTHVFKCTDNYECVFDFDPCDIERIGGNVWFISLWGEYSDFYDLPTEFTIRADWSPAVVDIAADNLITTHWLRSNTDVVSNSDLSAFAQRHYRLRILDQPGPTDYLTVRFQTVDLFAATGTQTLQIYFDRDAQAGRCPCYSNTHFRSVVANDNCGQTSTKFVFPPCDFIPGTYYFNVQQQVGGFIQFQIQAWITTQPIENFGTPNNLVAGGPGVFHLGTDPFLYLSRNIDRWVNWNTNQIKRDIELTQGSNWVHYTFTTTTAYANVWYAVNNVVEYECDTDFLGLDVWFNYGGLYTGFWGDSCDTQCPEVAAQSVSLCTAVNVGDDIPNVPCFGALPRCNLAEAGEYSLSFRGSFTPQTRGDLTYSSGISRITFDLRLFTQTPLPLAENTFINVTNFFGQPQEFVLTIPNAGVAPMAQIVIHEIQTPLRVYLRPAPLAGDMDFCAGEDCYDHSCIEVRSGYPVTNDEVLVDGDPIPDLSAFGTGDNVCGRSGNTDCYVALFPCALKTSTTWYLTIVSEEGENDFQYPDSRHRGGLRARDNSYRLFWDSLGDVADTIDQITQSDIDARARLPGVEDGTEDFYFVEEMDSYYLFQFSVTGLSQSIFNGTLDNSDYTRLEVQINTLGGGIALDGDLVVAVAPGTVPPIVPLQGLQAGGHMLESCDSCVPSIYYCYSSAAAPSQCDEDDRLVVPACCLQNGPWWIVARLLTPGARGFRLRVRLVDEKDGTTLAERVDSSQFLSDVVTPLTYPSIVSGLQNDVTGIEPDNYIHYYTTLSESQFYTETASGIRRNALIFTLSKNLLAGDVARPGNVWLYVRRGAVAGQPGRQGGVIWGEDYCHQATYSCVVANDEDVCVIEIPSCQLAADNWFFSVYNDAWYRDFASGLTSPTDFTAGDTNAFYNYLGFDLNIYLRPEESVISAVTSDSVVCINRTESDDAPSIAGTSAHGTYVHYTFTVDDAALAAGCATGDLNCKYEKFLRFEVHNDEDNDAATISSDIDVFISAPYTMTINENAQQLAGQPGSSQVNRYLIPSDIYYGCADGVTNKQVFNVDVGETAIFEAYTCPSDTQLHLRTGTYYLTVRTFEERSYSVCAYMVHPVFETLPAFAAILPVDINDETASVGTSVSYTNSIPRDSEDPDDFYYRFVITPAQAENQRAYLQINLTDVISCTDNAQTDCEFPTNFDDQFYIRVWRSDCESWSCDECALETYYATDPVSTDESDLVSRYVFDRFGMSLCSLESGTYYVHIHNVFGFYDFTLNVRLRTALLHVASFDVPIVSQIWKYQYHVYQLDVSDTRGKSITASLFGDVSCGTLEMFAKHGTPAGPNAPLVASVSTYSDNGCDKCASAYCQTGPQDADTNAVGCDIFIDTFTLSGGAGEQATWYFTVHALSQLNHLVDYLESPVTYNLLFTSHSFEFVETQNGWGCTNVLTYDNTLPACSGSEPDANIPPQQFVFDLDYVPLFGRFALRVDGATAKVVVARNMTVPFGFSGGVGTNDGTIAFDTINPSLFITSTGSQTHSLVTRSATCTANNYLWGPTELNVWVEAAPNTASLSLIRVAAYVANIYPGITYAATVNEPQSYFASFANWYRLADYNRDNFQFRFSWEIEYVVNGDVTFDLYGVAVSDVTNDCDPLTSILSFPAPEGTSTNIHTPQYFLYGVEPRFIRVSGVSQSCANCNPIGYAFHYNLVRVIDHEQLSCGTSFCDVIDDGLEAVYEFLDPFYPIESSRDTTYTVDVPTFTLTDTGSDAPTNAWRTYGLGLATEAQLIAHSYSTVSTSTCAAVGSSQPGKVSLVGLCPFDYLVVQSPSGVPVYPAYFPFRLETVCTPLEITDVTSQVIGTGFVSEVGTAEMAVFSFDLAAASSLEFHNLDISISASCPGVSYTVSATGPSTTACALSSCALTPLQAAVHYVTVHCTADVCDWVLSIHLEEITNTQLTLGAQSTLFQNTGEWDVYYFDVDSLNIDDYLQVEVLSLSANADQEDTSLSVIITQDGSLFDSAAACHCIDSENFQFDFMGTTLGSTVDTAQTVIVDHCYAQATRYYVYIRSPVGCDAHPTQFSLRPLRVSYEISPAALTNGVGLSGSLRFDPTNSNFNFYSFERSGRLGQIRLSDVSGGVLELLIQAGELPRLDSTSYLTSDIYSDLFGRSPFSPNNRVDRTCADCPDPWTCTTDNQLFHTRPADPLNNDCGSCSLAVEDCAWSSASTWYALVSIVSQENVDVPITYTITADDFEDWTSIAQGETSTAVSLSANTATPRQSFGQGNWEHFFYSISTGGNLGAISLRVTVTGDNAEDGVFVTVKDSSCTPEAFFKNIWCSAEYPNWVCEVEIPTRAEYLTSSDTFYIDVYGRQGTFSLTYTYGTDNCQDPTYALSFCSGYVAYPVWNYLDTERYDSEAECLYNELKWRFERERYQSTDCPNEPCWTGISSPCDDNLRRFACYETFPACDGSGFVTGTCRQACQNVEEVCDISFASVDLEQYDCQSSRYLNGNRETCSGAEQLPAPSFDF